MLCPECLSDEVTVQEYDFGICPQTEYHDAGERFRCRVCGASRDAKDLEKTNPSIA
jgi:rubredoxin